MHFKIITSFYNVEEWLKYTIRSIKAQDYEDFQCILTNDMSTDKSLEIAKQEVGSDSRFLIIDNQQKKNALENNANAINLNSSNEDVIVVLDGDDWFSSKSCLSTLKEVYEKEDCWMTYGSYIEYPANVRGKFARKCPQNIIEENSYRKNPWFYSHLKTFKYFLWANIREEDLIDPDTGNYFQFTQDLAFMFPLLEMSGNRAKYIQKPLYIYNLTNPLNDHKVDHTEQLRVENVIRSMERYDLVLHKALLTGAGTLASVSSIPVKEKKQRYQFIPDFQKLWENADALLLSSGKSGSSWLRFCVEFLSGRPTYGPSIKRTNTLSTIDLPLLGQAKWDKHDGYVDDKAILAKSHDVGDFSPSKLILLLRNYKELVYRPDPAGSKLDSLSQTESADTDRGSKAIDEYVEKLKFYDDFKGEKTIVFYEDLITDFKSVMNSLVDFLNLGSSGHTNLEHLMEDFSNLKEMSFELYRKSITMWVTPTYGEAISARYSEEVSEDEYLSYCNNLQHLLVGDYVYDPSSGHLLLLLTPEMLGLGGMVVPELGEIYGLLVDIFAEPILDLFNQKSLGKGTGDVFALDLTGRSDLPDTIINLYCLADYRTYTAKSGDIHQHSSKFSTVQDRKSLDLAVKNKSKDLFEKYLRRYEEGQHDIV